MRILQVRFKNLNSLVGEWEIDFSHPALASEGIVAITGPTGAGKSTILDAICLALYGHTPRLNKISKSGNEVLSRKTGECFAEVCFETRVGRFRCHWSQHRARKRPEGELQSPRHEIADALTGKLYESKIRDVADQIEAVTGMNFKRFTRSMLLAQGNFAAFLLAVPDERSPILEQITGTEIYSDISKKVHELRSLEQKNLEGLRLGLAGLPVLSGEEEAALRALLAGKEEEDALFNRDIARLSQALSWREGLLRLEEELRQLALRQEELDSRLLAFAPEEEKLRRAGQALEMAGSYGELASLRRARAEAQGSHARALTALPLGLEKMRQCEEASRKALARLEACLLEQRALVPLARKAAELDLQLGAKKPPLLAAERACADTKALLSALGVRHANDSAELARQEALLNGLELLLENTQADAALADVLPGLRAEHAAWREARRLSQAKKEDMDKAAAGLSNAARACLGHEEKTARAVAELAAAELSLAEKEQRLAELLKGKNLSAWREELVRLTAQSALLERAADGVSSLSRSRSALERLGKEEAHLGRELANLPDRILAGEEKRALARARVELLETQAALLLRIADFEEARVRLEQGQPCPLCGSLDHPFAQGLAPATDANQEAILLAREDLRIATEGLMELELRRSAAERERHRRRLEQKEQGEAVETAWRRLEDLCAELGLAALARENSPTGLEEELQKRRELGRQALKQSAGIAGAVDALEKERDALRASLEQKRAAAAGMEREALELAHRQNAAQELCSRLSAEVAALEEGAARAETQLQERLRIFDAGGALAGAPEAALAALEARRERWSARREEKAELERRVVTLKPLTAQQRERLEEYEASLKRHEEQRRALLREVEDLERQRREAFADKDPAREEGRVFSAVESARAEGEKTGQALHAAKEEYGRQQTRAEELAAALTALEGLLNQRGATFAESLRNAGFADEAAYHAACLEEKERMELARKARELAEAKAAFFAQESEKKLLLETEKGKALSPALLEELRESLAQAMAGQKALQQEMGGLVGRLQEHALGLQKREERAKNIAAQERECARWDLLHELIGSADGKKYRNFAQGLTFDSLIGHANRHLRKMGDRYLLTRSALQPLELNVIDNYQAGETRSTRNLSGGESFLVSLALALGLSTMASENVRVDSLFLDEGFGTLDEEALDTALECLAGLHGDGKLIVVISHVQALKERVGRQIEVLPQAGGTSRIQGPGCSGG